MATVKDRRHPVKKYGKDTLAVHGNDHGFHPDRALSPPIFQTSTFAFESLEQVEKVMSFKSDDYVYTRGNNPTLRLFENKMAALEGGKAAVAFGSGMGAVSGALMGLLEAGDHLIIHQVVYGSSFTFCTHFLKRYGVECTVVDMTNLEAVKEAIQENTKVIYFETPANPSLDILDIKRIVAIANDHGCKVVVDNTFSSPYFQQPLALGVDIVLHSCTKYISGHGDVVGGVVIASDEALAHKIKFDVMCETGSVMSPFDAWLLLRGLKTLGVRMREIEKNAKKIALFLAEHPRVTDVKYPGLTSHPQHDIACEQMSGFGGIITFEIDGDEDVARRAVESLKLFTLAVSLGDCDSLVEIPAMMTHIGYSESELQTLGLSKKRIRLSVGIENVEDLIDDLSDALEMR